MIAPPANIGRYQVLGVIGRGGMGTLYLGRDPRLDRQVAIKLLNDDNDELRERFEREARSAARLHHPHIVTIFDVGEDNGRPFIAMEYIQGETLADLIRNRAPLTLSRKLKLIEELCDGLAHAHRAGIIHRDIKPANIMVDAGGQIKILDFGIARITQIEGLTRAGSLIGTLNYMSPEQVSGRRVDQRTDIFAVGAVFYELLSYRQAFPGGIEDGVLYKLLETAPEPLGVICPDLDPRIIRIVNRALEKDPAFRQPELGMLMRDLQQLRHQMPTDDHSTTEIAVLDERTHLPTARPTPTPTPDASRREQLARRRSEQIERFLKTAEEDLAQGDYEKAIAACEDALVVAIDEPRALVLLERAKVALDDRQVREWLDEAQRALARGALTATAALLDQVEALRPQSPEAAALRQAAVEATRQREQARKQADALRRALNTAYALFDKGDFQAAISAANDALALDPRSGDATALKSRATDAIAARARAELIRRAREVVKNARALFGSGSHEQAIDLLARFDPPTDTVSHALDQLRHEFEQILEERRLEAERRAREQRIATELALARTDFGRGQYGQALQRLHALVEKDGTTPEIALFMGEIENRQTEQVREWLDEAQRALAGGALTATAALLEQVEALRPGSPEAALLRQAAEEAMRQRELARKQAEALRTALDSAYALFDKGDFPAAISAADDALALDPTSEDATALKSRATDAIAARARTELIRRAREAVKDARALFGSGSHEQAIELLARFEPPTDIVSRALDQLRHELEQILEEHRIEAERRAREQRIAMELALARAEFGREQYAQALQRLHTLVEKDGTTTEIALLIRDIENREAEIERTEREIAEHLARGAGFLTRHDLDAAASRVAAALALDLHHRGALALHAKVQDAIRTAERLREAAELRAREKQHAVADALEHAQQADSHSAAIEALSAGLAVDPDNVELRAQLERHQELLAAEQAERRRRLEEEDARREQFQRVIADARQHLERDDLEAARAGLQLATDLEPEADETRFLAEDIESEQARRIVATAPPPAPTPAAETIVSSTPTVIRPVNVDGVLKTDRHAAVRRPRRWMMRAGGLVALTAVISIATWALLSPRQRIAPPKVVLGVPPIQSPPEAGGRAAVPRAEPNVGLPGSVDQSLADLRRQAHDQFARNEWKNGAATVAKGLTINRNDSELISMLNAALNDVKSRADSERASAASNGQSITESVAYRVGIRKEKEANDLVSKRDLGGAILAFSEAVGIYRLARSEARPPDLPTPPGGGTSANSIAAVADNVLPQQVPTPSPTPTPPSPASPSAPVLPPSTPNVPQSTIVSAEPPPSVIQPTRRIVPTTPSDETLIVNTLRMWADGYSSLDVAAVKRVFPSLPERDLKEAFSQLKSQATHVDNIQIRVTGATATASCVVSSSTRPKVGNGLRRDSNSTFSLQKNGGSWEILAINMR